MPSSIKTKPVPVNIDKAVKSFYRSRRNKVFFIEDLGEWAVYEDSWTFHSDKRSVFINEFLTNYCGMQKKKMYWKPHHINEFKEKLFGLYKFIKTVYARWERPDNNIIPLRNGVYDLKTKKKRPEKPDDRCRYHLNVNYDPKAECPLFIHYLLTTVDPRDLDELMKFLGYTLLSNNSYQKSLVLIGEGSNGKSVLLEVLENIFDDMCRKIPLQFIHKEYKMALFANTSININGNSRLDLSKSFAEFEEIVTDSHLEGGVKYVQKTLKFYNRVKLINSVNRLATPPENADHHFWRRFIFIHYPNKFEETNPRQTIKFGHWVILAFYDKDLVRKLLKQKSGILNALIKGYVLLTEEGFADSTRDVMLEWGVIKNPVSLFVEESCKRTGSISVVEFRRHFKKWYGRKVSTNYVTRQLKRIGVEKDKGWKNNKTEYSYEGISWKKGYTRSTEFLSANDESYGSLHFETEIEEAL